MPPRNRFRLELVVVPLFAAGLCTAQVVPPPTPAFPIRITPKAPGVGEKVPSEDPVLWCLHSMGLVNGYHNIFRSASPIRDLQKAITPVDEATAFTIAKARVKRLRDLGVRTIISFEDPDSAEPDDNKAFWIALERKAAAENGIRFVSRPMANDGPNSLETMSDAEVVKLLDSVSAMIFKHAGDGGVLFHCSAGHDRAGIVAAYIRLKYQAWPVEQAIEEMRRYGHNWPKYSKNGGVSSWHEDRLRVISATIKPLNALPSAAASQPASASEKR